jgi:tetratricopeptide (TPR) repeat protein
MLSTAISRVILSFILLAFLVCGASAQQNLPDDANQVKTPQEANKGGMGLYLAKLGFDELKKGNNEEAVKHLKKAIKLKPNYADAHEGLGRALGNLKHWPEAVKSFKQAIRLKPEFVRAHMGLGFAYGMLNRNHEAIKAFKEAARLDPRLSHAHWGLATSYLALGDRSAALREHKIMKNMDPEMAKRFEKYLK